MDYKYSELQDIRNDDGETDSEAYEIALKYVRQSTIFDYLNGKPSHIKTDRGNTLLVRAKDAAEAAIYSAIHHYERPFFLEVRDNKIVDISTQGSSGENIAAYLLPVGSASALINADIDEGNVGNSESIVTETAPLKLPSVSFRCLIRCLFPEVSENGVRQTHYNKLFQLLDSGAVYVVDHTPDVFVKSKTKRRHRHPTKKEQAEMKAKGFTYIYNGMYHKPSTVLISYDNPRGTITSFVLGVDESQYFGCELPGTELPSSVKEAFEALKPQEIRKKKNLLRQGEWFAVPVKGTVVPPAHQCLTTDDSVTLPKDSSKSAGHGVYAGDMRITPDGHVYAKSFTMEHSLGQHQNMVGKRGTWYTFVRNTAVRSVSQEGVD